MSRLDASIAMLLTGTALYLAVAPVVASEASLHTDPPVLLVGLRRSFTAQVSFEQTIQDLASLEPAMRIRAIRWLRQTGYVEAAIPLAALIADENDAVKLEAIGAEVSLFLSDNTGGRAGLAVEMGPKAAEAAFGRGPLALGVDPVPIEVLNALRMAAREPRAQVAVEALYAFGTLATEATGLRRHDVLNDSGRHLTSMLGASHTAFRLAAVRVMGRLFEWRPRDEPVDFIVGDAMVGVLNDADRGVRAAAMQALGAMRYSRAVSALTEQFRFFGKGDLAEASLDALARIAHPGSAPTLTALVDSKNARFKALAIEGLARTGDRTRAASLEAARSGEGNDRVLLAAAFAAALLSQAPIDPLVEALRRPALADRARLYVMELVRERPLAFARHTQDPDAELRLAIADSVGLAGEVRALPTVQAMLRDRDAQVARAAERAVARLTALRPKD